jgi:hypothetical protein
MESPKQGRSSFNNVGGFGNPETNRSLWSIVVTDSNLDCIRSVDVGRVANVSEVHSTSIFMVELGNTAKIHCLQIARSRMSIKFTAFELQEGEILD